MRFLPTAFRYRYTCAPSPPLPCLSLIRQYHHLCNTHGMHSGSVLVLALTLCKLELRCTVTTLSTTYNTAHESLPLCRGRCLRFLPTAFRYRYTCASSPPLPCLSLIKQYHHLCNTHGTHSGSVLVLALTSCKLKLRYTVTTQSTT